MKDEERSYLQMDQSSNNLNQPSEYTDISRYMLNVTSQTQRNFVQNTNADAPLRFKKGDSINDNEMKDLQIKNHSANIQQRTNQQNNEISQYMQELKQILDEDNEIKFENILNKNLENDT